MFQKDKNRKNKYKIHYVLLYNYVNYNFIFAEDFVYENENFFFKKMKSLDMIYNLYLQMIILYLALNKKIYFIILLVRQKHKIFMY